MAKETTKKSTKTTKRAPKAAAAKTAANKAVAKTANVKAKPTAKAAKPAERAEAATPVTPAASAKLDVKNTTAKRASIKEKVTGPSSKLKKWNYWLAGLYALQAIAIVILGSKAALPITAQYPAVDALASEAAGHQVIGGAFRQLFDVQIGWMVATFLIVFATIRYVAGRKIRVQDQPGTDRGVSALRWMSFGLGGGLVVVTIALLSGIYSVGTLLLLYGATLVGCVLAFATEVVIDVNKGMWTRFARLLGNLSVMSLMAPWVVFAIAVIGAAFWNGNLPAYMYSIYGCVALLFIGTALATYFYFARQGKWADPLYAERTFMVLEVLTASFLAWQIYAGVLHA
jgi:hypothetical protein